MCGLSMAPRCLVDGRRGGSVAVSILILHCLVTGLCHNFASDDKAILLGLYSRLPEKLSNRTGHRSHQNTLHLQNVDWSPFQNQRKVDGTPVQRVSIRCLTQVEPKLRDAGDGAFQVVAWRAARAPGDDMDGGASRLGQKRRLRE